MMRFRKRVHFRVQLHVVEPFLATQVIKNFTKRHTLHFTQYPRLVGPIFSSSLFRSPANFASLKKVQTYLKVFNACRKKKIRAYIGIIHLEIIIILLFFSVSI